MPGHEPSSPVGGLLAILETASRRSRAGAERWSGDSWIGERGRHGVVVGVSRAQREPGPGAVAVNVRSPAARQRVHELAGGLTLEPPCRLLCDETGIVAHLDAQRVTMQINVEGDRGRCLAERVSHQLRRQEDGAGTDPIASPTIQYVIDEASCITRSEGSWEVLATLKPRHHGGGCRRELLSVRTTSAGRRPTWNCHLGSSRSTFRRTSLWTTAWPLSDFAVGETVGRPERCTSRQPDSRRSRGRACGPRVHELPPVLGLAIP